MSVTLDDLRADPRPLVSVTAAAAALGLPRSTLYDTLRRGEFPVPPIRVGARVYLSKAALLTLVDGAGHVQEEGATPPTASGS